MLAPNKFRPSLNATLNGELELEMGEWVENGKAVGGVGMAKVELWKLCVSCTCFHLRHHSTLGWLFLRFVAKIVFLRSA